mmetsp:Transcript_39082/g.91537  ORF Transcript_39082/g.91537 Transcript_39082/m.91537 type:complete len:274 (-) Transcript_39082:977-1798(-)
MRRSWRRSLARRAPGHPGELILSRERAASSAPRRSRRQRRHRLVGGPHPAAPRRSQCGGLGLALARGHERTADMQRQRHGARVQQQRIGERGRAARVVTQRLHEVPPRFDEGLHERQFMHALDRNPLLAGQQQGCRVDLVGVFAPRTDQGRDHRAYTLAMVRVAGFEHPRVSPRDPFPSLRRREQRGIRHVLQPNPIPARADLRRLELGQHDSQRCHAIMRSQHPQAFSAALGRFRMCRFVELLGHVQALAKHDTLRPHLLGGAQQVLVQDTL